MVVLNAVIEKFNELFCAKVIILCFAFLVASCSVDIPKCEITSVSNRTITHSRIQLKSLWGRTGLTIENFEGKLLLTSFGRVLLTASTGCNEVVALDINTGDVVWRTSETVADDGILQQPSNITLDSARTRIYVSAVNSITAISLTDGNELWSNTSDNFVRNAHAVFLLADGQVIVKTNNDKWFINPYNGDLQKTPIQQTIEGLEYIPTIDEKINKVITNIHDYKIISNAVKSENLIYVLDADARLHLLNSENGNEFDVIEFQPPDDRDFLYGPGAIGGSWIAIEENVVIIYFQDTDVFSAYKIDLSLPN